ncbi:MAG TPA: ATP synthase F1 subunit epsilon [Ruminococcaceae bacterium]|jgi:F-type H+-transporting ATPase subunit epsilon|nr:ATP synthase F1 subunit epsilon [Oscillospiraceae bacterium]HBJ26292.1 ATP synthase F1 subunit epsilon [Oscillospiraceae bacterium]
MTPFKLQIITPEKTFFDGETEQIIARTTVGDVGILNGHEPYCAALGIGQMRVMIDGQFRRAATTGGIIKVSREKTVILVQACEWADEIDVNRAEHAKEVAEGRIKAAHSDNELRLAEAKLKRALNRIDAANLR